MWDILQIVFVDFCNSKISLLLIQEICFEIIFSLDSSKAYREAPINTVDVGHIGHSIYQRGQGPKCRQNFLGCHIHV